MLICVFCCFVVTEIDEDSVRRKHQRGLVNVKVSGVLGLDFVFRHIVVCGTHGLRGPVSGNSHKDQFGDSPEFWSKISLFLCLCP